MGLEQSFHYSCPQSSIQWGLSSSLTSLGVNTMLLNLLNSQRCSQWIYVSHSLGNVQIHQNSLMDGSFSCNVWFCTYIRYYASTYANCFWIYKHKPLVPGNSYLLSWRRKGWDLGDRVPLQEKSRSHILLETSAFNFLWGWLKFHSLPLCWSAFIFTPEIC